MEWVPGWWKSTTFREKPLGADPFFVRGWPTDGDGLYVLLGSMTGRRRATTTDDGEDEDDEHLLARPSATDGLHVARHNKRSPRHSDYATFLARILIPRVNIIATVCPIIIIVCLMSVLFPTRRTRHATTEILYLDRLSPSVTTEIN